jgi:hypothetical protein
MLNVEPEQKDRIYYRHVKTGELAYVVIRDGRNMLKTNRPSAPEYYDLPPDTTGGQWYLDKERRALNGAQVAMIAYAADSVLTRCISHQQPKEWATLTDEQRRVFTAHGPPKNQVERYNLYSTIVESLKEITGR